MQVARRGPGRPHRWMTALDRIRLIGLLRRSPAPAGLLYWPGFEDVAPKMERVDRSQGAVVAAASSILSTCLHCTDAREQVLEVFRMGCRFRHRERRPIKEGLSWYGVFPSLMASELVCGRELCEHRYLRAVDRTASGVVESS